MVFAKVDLESGEFFVEFGIFDLSPVNEIEVLSGLDERENL